MVRSAVALLLIALAPMAAEAAPLKVVVMKTAAIRASDPRFAETAAAVEKLIAARLRSRAEFSVVTETEVRAAANSVSDDSAAAEAKTSAAAALDADIVVSSSVGPLGNRISFSAKALAVKPAKFVGRASGAASEEELPKMMAESIEKMADTILAGAAASPKP